MADQAAPAESTPLEPSASEVAGTDAPDESADAEAADMPREPDDVPNDEEIPSGEVSVEMQLVRLLVASLFQFIFSVVLCAGVFKFCEIVSKWSGFFLVALILAGSCLVIRLTFLWGFGLPAPSMMVYALALFAVVPAIKKFTYVPDWIEATKAGFAVQLGAWLLEFAINIFFTLLFFA